MRFIVEIQSPIGLVAVPYAFEHPIAFFIKKTFLGPHDHISFTRQLL